MKNAYRILGYRAEMKDFLEELGTEGSIMLKWILKKQYDNIHWIHFD